MLLHLCTDRLELSGCVRETIGRSETFCFPVLAADGRPVLAVVLACLVKTFLACLANGGGGKIGADDGVVACAGQGDTTVSSMIVNIKPQRSEATPTQSMALAWTRKLGAGLLPAVSCLGPNAARYASPQAWVTRLAPEQAKVGSVAHDAAWDACARVDHTRMLASRPML